jgi:methionine aminotransferase
MASEAGAINLAQGFPGFGADPVLLELLAEASLAGHNQYAPMSGLSRLKRRLQKKLSEPKVICPTQKGR